MKKHLFILALLALLLVDNDASAQTTAKPTNEQLEAQITKLEKEIDELKSVDELKSDIQDSLLNKEKDNSSKIYDATMYFIAVLSVLVGIGSIIIGLLINKLNTYQKELKTHQKELNTYQKELKTHQKKIDLVLDSKEFDMKVTDIEQRLVDIHLKVRTNIMSNAKREFESLCNKIDKKIVSINFLKEKDMISKKTFEIISANLDTSSSQYQKEKTRFIDIQDTLLDDDKDTINIEESLVLIMEELEGLLEAFEGIEKDLNDNLIIYDDDDVPF
ncbi:MULTISPECIES: hypothetical protein [Bacillaceae]|uniref:hypothetical protein n=1 Tax=Bacillaceae TaxID=186817 RepID=UPI00065FF516|nr:MULTISPECIES: hypothetical protein [Bacillaceae]MCF7623666.1 hypothetical protein [Peribacillus frigoritolerans]PRA94502.1 hypothetical protein CQ056_05300 [Peribacillus simplex]